MKINKPKDFFVQLNAENYENRICLSFLEKTYAVSSNSSTLLATLKEYFKEWIIDNIPMADIEIKAKHMSIPMFDLKFENYKETSAKKLKEQVAIVDDYSIIKKVKTGVHFASNQSEYFAFGPLEEYSNQLINFLNALFMELHLTENAQLFHAAAVAKNNEGILLAAQSGKGKSTTALNLMNQGLDFVSNDRIVLQKSLGSYTMIGVPKHPRVNPGTLLNNNKVRHLLYKPERFNDKTKDEIWAWEEKYDVVIPDIYGAHKFKLSAKAKALVIIDWGGENGLELKPLELKNRNDLLPAIMKTPSIMTPQINSAKSNVLANDYIDFLNDLPVYVLQGKIDAEKGVKLIMNLFFEG